MTEGAARAIETRLAAGPLGDARAAALAAVAAAAAAAGRSAWLVGGAVRDALLGLDPGGDLDVVVDGGAADVVRRLESAGSRAVVHGRFGTATWRTDAVSVDLVSARAEAYERPGALPAVRAGSLRDDLARRDFALNAIAASLRPGGIGELVDTENGRADLDRGLVRVLHARSFLDDPTRVLRAARFTARLGFVLEPDTADLARAAIEAGALDTVSPARLRRELLAVLREARPGAALDALVALGVLRTVPGGRAPRALDALPPAWARLARSAPGLGLAGLPDDAAREAIWRAAAGTVDEPPAAWPPEGARLAAVQAGLGWRRAAALRAAPASRLARAHAGRPAAAIAGAWLLAPWPEARAALRRLAEDGTAPCPIDGRALLHLGVPQGPALGRLLDRVQDAWRDGRVRDADAALMHAAELAGEERVP